MRLGVIPRALIVASAAWMVAGPLYFFNKEMTAWEGRTRSFQELCLRMTERFPPNRISQGYEDCANDARRSSNAMISSRGSVWWGGVGIAAILLICARLALGILYGAGKWILAGRKK